ncbi:TetR/AcrR family transcriptional regulator [Tissierella carlieri]|jgi:AcrR family transcriptional regulator|uniref:TetR/AcrR family transcriptional regulator n=1 Tax=Tissierella carlieri TaxID=689904 RepID=UPI002805BCF1|nr:helix-turn-helix domain-containing protein [uncultured Tissierella sp.]MDU5080936.1 helix-turn-helix domain-containing protein [Bacillota bacterium]
MADLFNEDLELMDTKNKIIAVAIEQFSDQGYDNTSIRKIADIVGIKGSSIYNHFNSKEEILEEIFKYYRNLFYQMGDVFEIKEVPLIDLKEDKILYILKGGFDSVINILKRPEMINILKIIIKEQFKNQKIRNFFLEEFIDKPRKVMEKFMKELMDKGIIREGNPYLYSQEFQAFAIYKMYEEFMLKDVEYIDIDDIEIQINHHIEFFWNSIRK